MNAAFNRDLKNNYSWLPIGVSSKIINNRIQGRWTIIASIFSDGNFLWMITRDIVKTQEFIKFLSILKYVLKLSKTYFNNDVCITLDNAPVHTSTEALKYLNSLKIPAYFLPPHSPNLAPVELFFRLI